MVCDIAIAVMSLTLVNLWLQMPLNLYKSDTVLTLRNITGQNTYHCVTSEPVYYIVIQLKNSWKNAE